MRKLKELSRLLKRKRLKPPEAERMIRIDGWVDDLNDTGGTSHKQFIHPTKKGKVTIPFHVKEINSTTTHSIKEQAGLL